jgi:hypothetical protein
MDRWAARECHLARPAAEACTLVAVALSCLQAGACSNLLILKTQLKPRISPMPTDDQSNTDFRAFA